MSSEDELAYNVAINCHICGRECKGEDRVRDHCHVTGKFRGLAHKKCNPNFKLTDTILVVFHNLRGYDSHLTKNCPLVKVTSLVD